MPIENRHFKKKKTRESRVSQFLTLYIQVGALSATSRFQRPTSEVINSSAREACILMAEAPGSLKMCVGSNMAISRTPQVY